MTDLYNAQKSGDKSKFSDLAKSLRVPDSASWFKKVFGDDKGAKASVQYDTNISQIESELDKVFAKMVDDGQSEIKITKIVKADDAQANGNQKDALLAMQNPVPIYSARFVKPGEPLGQHLYNFVYVDGSFRLAGKMDAVKN